MHDAGRGFGAGGESLIDEAERTSRQRALLWMGEPGQRRLQASRVLIVGAGGLAAPIVQYLAGAGIGRLDLIDFDVVEPSNLARQVLFTAADIGRPKTAALAEAAARIAPSSRVEGHQVRLSGDMSADLLRDLVPDVVIDTTDDWTARLLVADACRELRIPLVWPTVIGTDGQLTVFSGADGDPVLDDLVDRAEAPRHPVSCAEQGVLGSVCGQVGTMAATETIKLLVGAGRPLIGRVAIIDGLGATVREVPLVPRRGPAAGAPEPTAADAAGVAVEPAGAGNMGDAAVPSVATRVFPVTLHPRPFTPPTTSPARPGAKPAPGVATAPGVAAPAAAPQSPGQVRERAHLVTIAELVAAPLGTVLIDAREESAAPLPWPPEGLELLELVRAPLESLASAIDAGELPLSIERASRVVVTCAFGPRARHAAAMLRAAGVAGVAVLDEGTAGLRLAVEAGRRAESAHA